METSALSLAYAAVDAATEGNAFESAALVRAKARGLLEGYDHRYRDAGWVAMGVEQTFHQPIVNPNSGRRSRTFTHAGKWDGTVSFQGQAWLLEHKTTCQDISDLSAPYWRQLAIDSQVSGYMLAHWQGGERLAGTLYDVIRKPQIRPKNVAGQNRKEVFLSGCYFGRTVSDASLDALPDSMTPASTCSAAISASPVVE